VLLIGFIELGEDMIFVLWVVLDLEWNSISSPYKYSSNLQIRFSSIDSHGSKTILSEMIESLQESIHKIQGMMELLSFTLILVIVDVPDGETSWVILLPELSDGLFLIRGIDDEGLEVEEIEGGWWEVIQWVLCLFFGLFTILVLILYLRFGFILYLWFGFILYLWLRFILLFWGFEAGAEGWKLLLGKDGWSIEGLEVVMGGQGGEPLSQVGETLSELVIEVDSEGEVEGGSEDDVSDGEGVVHKEVLSLERVFEDSNGLIEVSGGLFGSLGIEFGVAVDW